MIKRNLVSIFFIVVMLAISYVVIVPLDVNSSGTGLVAHWKFDEGIGVNAEDSVDGFDGMLNNGPKWTNGINKFALDFDGKDDYVDLGNPGWKHETGTIMAWIKTIPHVGQIVSISNGSSKNNFIQFYTDENKKLSFIINDGINYYFANYIEMDGNWHQVALTQDSSIIKMYFDGSILPGTKNCEIWLDDLDGLSHYRIGNTHYNNYDTNQFKGAIDEVRIYDRALSACEIEELFYSSINPIADAGPDQTVNIGEEVQFDGSGSYDPDEILDDISKIMEKSRRQLSFENIDQITPSFTPNGLEIIYSSKEDGGNYYDVWIMDMNGQNRRQLTFENHDQIRPKINNQGTKVVFEEIRGLYDHRIFRIDIDRSNRVFLSGGMNAVEPNWSPDGTKIVFNTDAWNDDIWVMNSDGSNKQILTGHTPFHPPYEMCPDWSPDGNKIIYTSGNAGSFFEIWSMNSDGTGHTKLTSTKMRHFYPTFEPHGKIITFQQEELVRDYFDIWIMDIDTANELQLTYEDQDQREPRFSPYGTKIAYYSKEDEGGFFDIWILDLTELEFKWDFDASDGTDWENPDATGIYPEYIYNEGGRYIVTLNVTDSDGLWDIDTMIVTVLPIPATIDIDPDTIQLGGKGKWVTCYIELPKGYDVEDIDAITILLEDELAPVLDPKYDFVTNESVYISDHDEDEILERMVKFNRDDVEAMLSPGIYNLKVTGDLYDGKTFEGYSDEIRVINPP